eukprot:TRINITY_DN26452_c0_g1_i1.p1 TRINITY_DN26452_c0_g1~~TRINITY_DN26452_c0_g1_i1.p1  ORF type:complete len:191 (-),score=24.35 TRINITY_DN26452_c0_g1_i1:95-667(-)
MCIRDRRVGSVNVLRRQFEVIMKEGWLLQYCSTRKCRLVHSSSTRSLLKCSTLNNSPNDRKRKISPGHLIVKPRKKALVTSFENTSANKPKASNIFVDGIEFEASKEACAYEKYVQEKSLELNKICSKETVCPSLYAKGSTSGIKGKQTWSNREFEWYTAEERLLFVAKSSKECERWVCLLNWLVYYNNQ